MNVLYCKGICKIDKNALLHFKLFEVKLFEIIQNANDTKVEGFVPYYKRIKELAASYINNR